MTLPAPQADKPAPACPICGRPRAEPFRPFCSRRCTDIDLHRWLSGSYVVPGAAIEGDEEDGDDRRR